MESLGPDAEGLSMKTRILVILSLVVTIAVGVGYTQRATIAERLMALALPKQMGTNQVETLQGRAGPGRRHAPRDPVSASLRVSNYSLLIRAPTARAICNGWVTPRAVSRRSS